MKKNSGLVLFFMLWLFMNPLTSFGQIPDQIISGIKAGDAKVVASHFNENIELVVVDRELVCSKAQALSKKILQHHRVVLRQKKEVVLILPAARRLQSD